MPRRDVIFWYPAVSPYMVERFNHLSKEGRIDFECWFSRWRNPGRSWAVPPESLSFPFKVTTGTAVGSATVSHPITPLVKARPRLIVSFYGDPSVMFASVVGLVGLSKVAYYVESTVFLPVARSPMKEHVKSLLLRRAEGLLTPGPDADAYASQYGVSDSRLHRLEHAVSQERFAEAARRRGTQASFEKRKALGLVGTVFLYVGRIEEAKGVETLAHAFKKARRKSSLETSLLLCGDYYDEGDFLKRIGSALGPNTVLHPFVQTADLPDIMSLADVFVFPSFGDTYGIVVDEAMSSGLPVISSDKVGEIAMRIDTERNGRIVPVGNADALAASMLELMPPSVHRPAGTAAMLAEQHRNLDRWTTQVTRACQTMLKG